MNDKQDLSWKFWPLVPIYPYGTRKTIRKEVVRGKIWTFEQLQGIFYVVVPIRMSVVKLEKGGLLVYAPVAPTPECIRLLRELEVEHGQVKYIILSTLSGLEHKVFVSPFARVCPQAEVFVPPKQWSFPLNLPPNWLGFPNKRTRILPLDSSQVPFADQFDYNILGPLKLGIGYFAEVALLDKFSGTLFLTDSIVSIPEDPPEIVQVNPYPLLFHARDNVFDDFVDTIANRRKGWQRICLFALYFQPSTLITRPWAETFLESVKSPQRSRQAYFGLFPFEWRENWQDSFKVIRNEGGLVVPPILQTLILNRNPRETIDWADQVIKWDFNRIIPCHFDAPIMTKPLQFRQGFTFLENQLLSANISGDEKKILANIDLETLRNVDKFLMKIGINSPPKPKI